ncbi:MAG TPA: acetyl-CoA hydrolase/transferase C-terminal domain-containing protein [Dehalococcoidia bacterium]|nr:acetyl-CoA hydrolase/transferase C-terminal domain-containing protein [Dehalococcoidia bacterium]
MDWREDYKRKTCSADEAIAIVKRGDLVAIPIAGPRILQRALYNHVQNIGEIELRLAAPLTDPGWLLPGDQLFKIEFEAFISDFGRPATDEGRATYLPNLFSMNFKAQDDVRPETRPVDVFLTSVTPPDEEGYVQFGAHHWNKRVYVRHAKATIAEVDAGLRPVHGDNKVHVSEIDCFVEVPPVEITQQVVDAWLRRVEDEALKGEFQSIVDDLKGDLDRLIVIGPAMTRLPPIQVRRTLGLADPPEIAKVMAGFVSEILPDGACIQIGVGEPGSHLARAGAFDNKIDLGLHTEMVTPKIAQLVEAGVINGKRKNVHPGKAVAIGWSGSDAEGLKIVTNNPKFEVYDPDYLLDINLMSQNDNLHSINNALSIDLTGQINSESVFGSRLINGTGGQPDTHISAVLSRGGRAITLLPSTAMEGAVSRIVVEHEQGAMITIPRYFADTIVTEHGVARLWGKNHRQRAEELISIAHPDFRHELRARAAFLLGA